MIYCLGIHQVGRTACKELARRYRSYETLIEAIDDLITTRSNLLNGVTSPKEVQKVGEALASIVAVPGIGPEIISSLLNFYAEPESRRIANQLADEVKIEHVVQVVRSEEHTTELQSLMRISSAGVS